LHMLKAGDHVIAGDDMYGGTFRLMDKVIRHNGIEFSFVDLTDPENFARAVKPNTRMLWLETPTNPTLKLVNIRKLSAMASAKGILSVVDNTFMSPYFQRPLEHGATIVVHSATKYINGHSDVVGGVLVTSDQAVAEKTQFLSNSMGGIASPFDSFLCMRSLKTLGVRMRAHEAGAREVAKFLEKHPKVARVIYPGLESHPQHALAREQMSGFGGMITFYVKGGLSAARATLENVKVFALAESLGGVESLIEHPAIMTHASVPAETRKALGIDDGLIRLSVGIENIEDLLRDLDHALSKA
jgi:cystathionine gamma-lyase